MQKSVLVPLGIVLTACGVAATTSNDAAESAMQKNQRNRPPKGGIGFQNYEQGGMAGCFDPNLTGYARAAAERVGGVPCGQSPASGQNGAARGDSWAGEYEGPFDGGTGHVSISGTGNRLAVEVSMFSDHGCGGSASGSAVVQGNRLTLTMPPQDGGQCRITMTRQGSGFQVQESNCSYYHGRSCEFTGTVTRRGAAAARVKADAAPAAPRDAASIAGAWAFDRRDCDFVAALNLRANGSFFTDTEAGSWRASGNTLTLITRETFDDSGNATPLRSPRQTHFRVTFSRGGMTLTGANGRATNFLRCPG